jgi:hypothetical protein
MSVSKEALVALAKAAAAESANYQQRFAATDTEARKIVDVMERFLRIKARVVYGGAAINAHLSPANKFYDPNLYLPDYDFMTPDPLQDCADLIVAFHEEGFTDVEAKFGIHEGTYKIFVNFRAAADVTYMPPDLYSRVIRDANVIDGIHYANVDFLRMNIYVELSRPAGNVSRWEKVYERLLLLNEEHPMKAGRCTADPLTALSQPRPQSRSRSTAADNSLHERIVAIGIEQAAIFLSGAQYLVKGDTNPDEVVLLMTERPALVSMLKTKLNLTEKKYEALGELLPARVELRSKKRLVAVIFETVACHSYSTVSEPAGYRLGSMDLLIQMYYAMYFAEIDNYLSVRLQCVIHALLELEQSRRAAAAAPGSKIEAHDVFPLDCIGHQPTMPELKRAHRERVRERKKGLLKALRIQDSYRVSRKANKVKAAKPLR